MAQYYTVLKQEQIKSRHGNRILRLTLVGVKDRQLWTTYLDPKNRNYLAWSKIIHRPYYGYLLSGIQIKDREKGLVSADSKIRIIYETQYQDEVYNELIELWSTQDAGNHFEDFFEQQTA
jgi:hypothetical protein